MPKSNTLSIENADLLMAMDAPREKRAAASGQTANREGKLSTLLTTVRTSGKGMELLQAETILPGWTRVYRERVVANVKPKDVAAMIQRRAKEARELAVAGVEHDPDYLGIMVVPSTGLKPSPSAGLGGRFYVIAADKLAEIPEADYANMIADIPSDAAIKITSVRPLAAEGEADSGE